MKVKFMDGPKAGDVRDIPNNRHRWAVLKGPQDAFLDYGDQYRPAEITDYLIYKYCRMIFENDHLEIVDTASLAFYSEPRAVHSDQLPFERSVIEKPLPNFLTDFDAWWRRLLWDRKVTQDRETRFELERLEDELAYNQL